jgi:hypothetical protein
MAAVPTIKAKHQGLRRLATREAVGTDGGPGLRDVREESLMEGDGRTSIKCESMRNEGGITPPMVKTMCKMPGNSGYNPQKGESLK